MSDRDFKNVFSDLGAPVCLFPAINPSLNQKEPVSCDFCDKHFLAFSYSLIT